MSNQKPRHSSARTFLYPVQFFELLCSFSAARLLPAITGLFSHADLFDHINPGHTLRYQSVNLPQLHDNLLGLGSFSSHRWLSAFLIVGADHFKREAQHLKFRTFSEHKD